MKTYEPTIQRNSKTLDKISTSVHNLCHWSKSQTINRLNNVCLSVCLLMRRCLRPTHSCSIVKNL